MDVRDWLDNYGKYCLDISVAENMGNVDDYIKDKKIEKLMLETTINNLSRARREIIVEHYIHHKSYGAIAKKMKFAKATIYQKSKRIVKELENILINKNTNDYKR